MIIRRGNLVRTDGIYMTSDEKMKTIEPESGYKYPEILEAHGIKHNNMKEKTETESLQ